ncbi:MAG: hypothetical protein ACREMQ_13845 [Longimicrobiales bacterium]
MPRQLRFARVFILFIGFTLTHACYDDEVYDLSEGIVALQLRFRGFPVNLTKDGFTTVRIPQDSSSFLDVLFLDAKGRSLPSSPNDQEMMLVSDDTTRVTYTRVGPLHGRLMGRSIGTATHQVSVFNIWQQRVEFGPPPLNVTVCPTWCLAVP